MKKLKCWNFIWRSTRRVWLVKTFGFTRIKEGIGSTHQGLLGIYTTNFESNDHQLESRAWFAKSENRIYQWHYVSGKELLEVLGIRRTLSDDNSTKDLTVHNRVEVSIGTIRGRNNAKALDCRNNWLIQSSNGKDCDLHIKGSEAVALIKDG